MWDEAVGLRWLDVDGRRLFTLAEGVATCVVLAERVSAVELTAGRELLAVVADGFAMLDPDTGSVLSLARAVAERTATMNDAGVDPHGRCWAGSAVGDDSYAGALYCLEAGTVTVHVDGLGMSNGIDFSPRGDVLYHVDSTAGTLRAWEYDVASGRLGDSRILLQVPERGRPSRRVDRGR